MDGLVKFSDYDIFGYLASGLVALALCDTIAGSQLVFEANWTIAHGAFIVIAAYLAGHVIAAGATLFFDRLLVRMVLGRPSDILMGEPRFRCDAGYRKWLFSGFLEPLAPDVQNRVLERANICSMDKERGEKAFWRAWPIIKRDPLAFARMESFSRLYGFCRNMSFIGLVSAIVFLFLTPKVADLSAHRWLLFWGSLLLSVAIFHRYLKFFRLYGQEVFSTYAEPSEEHHSNGLDEAGSN